MNKIIFYILLAFIPISCAMEQPSLAPSKAISKTALIELIKKQDARGVLFAIAHENAAGVIDKTVLKVALEQKKDQPSLSRTGSIFLMLTKHAPSTSTKKNRSISDQTHSIKSHHKSEKKTKTRTPAEQLKRMIKKKDLKGIEAFVGTSGVHFIDTDAIAYAQKKYDLLSESSNKDLSESKEFLILQILKKYDPNSVKDRRKSYAARSNSKKEERP